MNETAIKKLINQNPEIYEGYIMNFDYAFWGILPLMLQKAEDKCVRLAKKHNIPFTTYLKLEENAREKLKKRLSNGQVSLETLSLEISKIKVQSILDEICKKENLAPDDFEITVNTSYPRIIYKEEDFT